MKKVIWIMSIGALSHNVNAQPGASVVSDPGAYGYMAENGVVAAQQLEQLEKQMTMLEKAKETFDKVNQGIQSLNMLTQILRNQADIVKQIRSSYSVFERSGVFTPGELGGILSSYNDILRLLQEEIVLASKVAESDLFKMNDSERLTWLTKVKKSSEQSAGDVRTMTNVYERQKQKKQLIKTMSM